jgi:AcrR family transcriptional regulator
VALEAISSDGITVSMRDIARRAEVGMATLYRHFPTRDALLEALLRTTLDRLTARVDELLASRRPHDALLEWMRECVAFLESYGGIVETMSAALADEASALHRSCTNLRLAGARILSCAQADGTARSDVDGGDLLALIGALAWTGGQPAFAQRADHLLSLVSHMLLLSGPPDPL